jgi:hypothetical protein
MAEPAIIRPDSVVKRGEADAITGEVSTGLPALTIEYRGLTNDELATNSADGRVLKPGEVGDVHITGLDVNKLTAGGAGHKVDAALIPDLNANKITDGVFGEVRIPDLSASKINAGVFDTARIPNIDTGHIVDDAVTLPKIAPSVKGSLSGGPNQGDKGLREIGNALGGTARAAAAGDHSHGSGNSTDFDMLPQAHQDRILLARSRVRENIRNLDALTAAQFRLFVRELAIVAVAALNLEIEAPDYTAEERVALRKSGTPLPLFHEWRLDEGETLFDLDKPRYQGGFTDIGTVAE